MGGTQWEWGYVLLVDPFNVRWTRSTILLNKAHYGS
jgi:hypothetical protein